MTEVVKKALCLLKVFTEARPELGLSDLSRMTQVDKATAHRLLQTLREEGLIDQHPVSKLYRLGGAVLVLARVREAAFPFTSLVQPMLDLLSDETGETAHCSIYTNHRLAVIAAAESRRANRVSMQGAETLPFHATASGLAFLAYAPAACVNEALAQPLAGFTRHTCTDRALVLANLNAARTAGYAVVDKTYEEDVVGIAAPIFGPDDTAIGALAVAAPSHRWTSELERQLAKAVPSAAISLSRTMGHEPPSTYPCLTAAR